MEENQQIIQMKLLHVSTMAQFWTWQRWKMKSDPYRLIISKHIQINVTKLDGDHKDSDWACNGSYK